jgi:hypothetical protein
LEVPTIYKAYVRPKFQGIYPQNMARNMVLTYLHFRILEFPLNSICFIVKQLQHGQPPRLSDDKRRSRVGLHHPMPSWLVGELSIRAYQGIEHGIPGAIGSDVARDSKISCLLDS